MPGDLHPDRFGYPIYNDVTRGINNTDGTYPECKFIKCKKCGFTMNTARHPKSWGEGNSYPTTTSNSSIVEKDSGLSAPATNSPVTYADMKCFSKNSVEGMWLFDATTGTTITDLSGNNRDITLSADASTLSPLDVGGIGTLSFGGSTYWERAVHDTVWRFSDDATRNYPFSVAMIVSTKGNEGGLMAFNDNLVSFSTGALDYWYLAHKDGVYAVCKLDTVGGDYYYGNSPTGYLNGSDWFIYPTLKVLVFTCSGSGHAFRLWENGVEVSLTAFATSTSFSAENALNLLSSRFLWGITPNYCSNQRIGMLAIFNRCLGPDEVTQINNSLLASIKPDVIVKGCPFCGTYNYD
jgi:hypothetical protein